MPSGDRPILHVAPLGFPWQPPDPFLACMHHDDAYPAGDDAMAPPKSALVGRDIGMDFAGKDGWRMYHGDTVPGFPQHPHRGFETVTIARRGYIDHSDSLGATARFGQGDVQWLTAGRGIVHSEMFPLLEKEKGNPLELFQIWLNLPASDKMCEPHFSMLWAKEIPVLSLDDGRASLTVIAGAHASFGVKTPPPPPRSWASRANSDLAIWTLTMKPGARVTLPAAQPTSNRALYFFAGDALAIAGSKVSGRSEVHVKPDVALAIENTGAEVADVLLLQGRPIHEPIAQHGPFVMNTRAEIMQAFMDYQRTQFGGWPWPSDGPVHARDAGRFARRPNQADERAAE
jgi:redox-sensitive bicupin YhaK (pirin superfamily)